MVRRGARPAPFWLVGVAGLVVATGLALSGAKLPRALTVSSRSGPELVALVVTAGLVDGLNPCAFSTLLLYVGTVLGLVERSAQAPARSDARATLVRFVAPYASMLFAVYFVFGAGVTTLTRLVPADIATLIVKVGGAVLALWGLAILAEACFPGRRLTPAMPAAMARRLRRFGTAGTVGAGAISGGLVGLCAIPCSGAVYLAVV